MKKLLVIGPDTAEKLMMVTPAIRAIKNANPGTNLHLLTLPEWKDFVANNRSIDQLHLATGIREALAQLTLEEVDALIDFQQSEESHAIANEQGAKLISPKKGFLEGLLSIFKKKKTDAYSIAFEQASGMGIRDDGKGIQFSLDNAAALKSNDLPTALMAGFICIVLPEASDRSDVNFLKGIREFCEKINHPVLLLGEGTVSKLATEIAAFDDTKIYNATGKFSKSEMAHIVDMAKVVVGPSGHWLLIAAALKKKIVLLAEDAKTKQNISLWYDGLFLRQKAGLPYLINNSLLTTGSADGLLREVGSLMA